MAPFSISCHRKILLLLTILYSALILSEIFTWEGGL